jgi:alpha-tubulin suppressor-like RCC1 family protein
MGVNNHSVFLLNDGTVKAVGYNDFGQCGTGNTTSPITSIYTIPGLNNVKQVVASTAYTAYLMNDGTVKVVGANTYGQLGDGTTVNKSTIITVILLRRKREVFELLAQKENPMSYTLRRKVAS